MKKGWIICACVLAALLIVLAVAFRLTNKDPATTTTTTTTYDGLGNGELPIDWFDR